MATIYNVEKDKNTIYKDVRQRIITAKPELLHKLTAKKFADSLIFLKGFLSCFSSMSEEPIREEEINEFIIGELVNYIVDESAKPKIYQADQGSSAISE